MLTVTVAIKHLIAAGVAGHALLAAIAELEAAAREDMEQLGASRAPAAMTNAERQRRYRERKRVTPSVTENVTRPVTSSVTENVTRDEKTEQGQEVSERNSVTQNVTPAVTSNVTRNAANYAPPSSDKENTPTPLKEINSIPREGGSVPAYTYTREAEPVTVDFEPVDPPAPGLPLGDEPPAKRKRGRPAKPKSFLRSDWEPGTMPPDLEEMVSRWPDGLLASELEKFRDYWASEGKPKADWDATWRNRLRFVEERRRGNGRANGNGHNGNGASRPTGGAFASAAFDALRDLE